MPSIASAAWLANAFPPFRAARLPTAEIGRLIEAIREYGVSGVGQSSWGPTVFAICSSPSEAEALVDSLRTQPRLQPCDLETAIPSNRGAQIDVQAD